MHKTRYNALSVAFQISPRGPLLIKAGGISANPTLPDMQFVRTYHPEKGETVYIPGSSLKGVVRGFVEKALRTLDDHTSWQWACPTFPDEDESCAKKLGKEENSATIYKNSCGACRLFGHTRLKGRVAFTDLLPVDEVKTEIRYGVAISRLSHAVAHGPFEMEVAVAGTFEGYLILENFELWQLGLLVLAFQGMNSGLLQIGFGKNRGFGEVAVQVQEARLDEVTSGMEIGLWRGLADFVSDEEKTRYGLSTTFTLNGMPDPLRTEPLGLYTRRIYDPKRWDEVAQRVTDKLGTT
ncbi:MAG TPA: hypothetical protein DEF43_20375 [Chloroflexus aurantiacus]|uniref:CRISPR type III-associated protein domain-containing protein n=1 Tax=Chloroflexus aurantiacus (strain ATCC 29366 / DSM 635 / J-10-fl) TaxID=324602 RepID=A9WGH3_CHLAA|nr:MULTISPECIES: RAMP superfamily CRISPR-associated protein [Chloroflexus]ABY35505.1 protein of unknown function DUF324 [Chloroflexus aurantiacus J-10-fl]GIV92051.1 MAG: hypothetical protein KatS3mg056_0760 [Chloroflexus sp.]HBW69458.1 hypothetical protein [Chloroflexus aurantiacus]